MTSPKTILVTGPAGFIGSNFVQKFKSQFPRVKIIGIDDFSTGRRAALDKTITFYNGSIADRGLLIKIFEKHKPEYIFHFAALPRVSYSIAEPTKSSLVNILGTVLLLEMAKDYKTKRVIISSSSSVYGDAKKLPTSEIKNEPHPISPYALQKYTDELFAKMFSKIYGMDTVCLRYFNVFGPGQRGDAPYATVIGAWLEGLYFPNNKELFIEGDGSQSRDFCFVHNVVEANILAMKRSKKFNGDCFNIAGGRRVNLRTVKQLIEKYTNRKLHLEKRPARLGDIKHTEADINKARRLLGYQPKVNFKDGLKQTVSWFKTIKK